MKIAIIGGTGFIGSRLARALVSEGHQVVLIARGKNRENAEVRQLPATVFFPIDLGEPDRLVEALAGCDAIAHCAGINREKGTQTYERVHVRGTRAVVEAARKAGVPRIVALGFLRARPGCGVAYHESKWAAEEFVRNAGLDYTVIRAGMNYGQSDHFLHHLSRALNTFPVVALMGLMDEPVRPIAVEDLLRIFKAALLENRLSRQTVAVVGPEELMLSDAIRRVAVVVGKQPGFFRLPFFAHRLMARFFEWFMTIPLISKAQVEIFAEGLAEPAIESSPLPEDLQPRLTFSEENIRRGLPFKKPFGLKYCLVCIASGSGRAGRCPMREAQKNTGLPQPRVGQTTLAD